MAVVTGARSEFGLLAPVMRAIAAHPELELCCIAAGSHLISPAETFREVKAGFNIADIVPMQIAGRTGRAEDAEAVGRGIGRFTRAFSRLEPDWVVVLGDRIEAFAAAAAASIGGWALAHIHGGDRAEGVADDAMRHAISKLAHLHLAATAQSAQRLVRMGENPARVRLVGSPAVDGLDAIPPLSNEEFEALGNPWGVFLFHPVGRSAEAEEASAANILAGLERAAASRARPGAFGGARRGIVALMPNLDAGRDGIVRAIRSWAEGADGPATRASAAVPAGDGGAAGGSEGGL